MMNSSRLNLFTFLSSLLGVGFIPFAPGTFGSLFAAGVYLLMPKSLFRRRRLITSLRTLNTS